MQNFGRIAPRECERVFAVIARSEATKQSMLPLRGAMDCFASLAMTASGFAGTTRIAYPNLSSSYPFAATSSHLAR